MPTASQLDVQAVRREFPALEQHVHGKPLAYLDNAATSQRPVQVIDAEAGFYRHDNANVHRGLYELSLRATDLFEGARRRVAGFINAPEAAEVVWTRGTTESINLVASSWGRASLREGDEILVTVLDHHSNLVPWQLVAEAAGAHLRAIEIDDDGRLRLDALDDALAGGRVRLVAMNHVSNALGTINPVAEVSRRAHDAGALVLVDGAQAVPHLPVDVQGLGCDFYAFSGHKMGGPMGIGVLWARHELLESMPPYQGGGEMIDHVDIQHSTWAAVPHKFEAGTPNVAGVVGLAAAVEFMDRLGMDAIREHERALTRHGLESLGAVPDLRLFGPREAEDRVAVFSFELDGLHPHDVATILDVEGIAVRAGHHCCQPLMRRLGVPATTRASCWVYNTDAELDRLARGLEKAREVFGL